MPEIKDEESLRAWLETRPPEDARIISARASLRALPGAASLFQFEKIKRPYDIILPIFRAAAAGNSAAIWVRMRPRLLEASEASALSAHSASNSFASAHSARSAARSASNAAHSATGSADITYAATTSAAFSVAAASEAALNLSTSNSPDAKLAVWAALDKDADRLEQGMAHLTLAVQPLWPDTPPEGLAQAWPTLRARLLEADPTWQVWTDWYQDRLDGKPINEALEIEKALIPDEDWDTGPAHVNAIIAELIAKHVPRLPESAPTPTDYVFTDDILEVAEAEVVASPNDATEVAWSVLRETLGGLKQGGISNSMRVAPAIDRTLSALGESPDQIDIIRCGMAGMELQAFSEIADSVLMEDAAAMLKAAVAQHALLVAQFEEWRAFKAQLMPPLGERQAEREAVRDAADLHHEMAEDGLLSEAADARMSEEAAAALPEPAVTGEVVTAEPESERGFLRSIRAAVRAFAADVLTKMRENAVKASAVGIPAGAGFVFVRYSETLTALATKLPTEFGWVLQWIQWLKAALV